MNYERFLNEVSLARQPSPIRVLTAILAKSGPSMISLAGGLPNPDLFPFQEAEFKLRDGTVLQLNEDKMKVALQYGSTNGLSDLLSFLVKLQRYLHNPPNFHWKRENGGIDICVTSGSQDGLVKSFEMLISPGDNVIVESPTYASALSGLRPLGCKLLGVESDGNGMIPSSLQAVLTQCEVAKETLPKFIYVIPNGVNPTGASLTLERRREIYKIARKYDLLILEDDPYYFLQFIEPRVPSFLSMDEDGRVLRFDSFSKVLSSGLRLGFVTGPAPLVDRLVMHIMVCSMHPAVLSQMMVSEILKKWDIEGFEAHVKRVAEFYRSQKDLMISAAQKWLKDFAEWNEPQGGMFLWLKLKGINDSKQLIEEKAQKKKVLLVPGCNFMPDQSKPCSFVRASFSIATKQQMDTAFQRLAELMKEELTLQNNPLTA